MLRRPRGHVAPQRKYLLALACILLPWLPLADAQQQRQHEHQHQNHGHHQLRSPPQDDGRHVAPNLAATPLPVDEGSVEAAARTTHQRRKTTVSGVVADVGSQLRSLSRAHDHDQNGNIDDDNNESNNENNNNNIHNKNLLIPDDVRAHTLAPDLSVRAPPPSPHRGLSHGAGLSQHVARSLEDWEVEDFVLLATVDGDLYASDRKTGQERWHFRSDQPLVETRHFQTNRSVLDDDYDPIDHYIWVVEPTRDGELYLWRPSENGAGLAKMSWTMKKVVEELAPFNDKANGVLYTGDKKTTMVTLNAATGTVVKEFGSTGSYVNKVDSESCFRPNALADADADECSDGRTITLGRTEYTVSIHRADGSPIASLKYSEWGPNTQDNDLMQQNLMTKDSRYVTGQHDGKVYGFDYGRFSEERPLFTKTLSSPVARVFDVLRRWGGDAPGVDPELIVLPQPPLPASDEDSLRLRSEKVFINQTEEGGWYALSGSRYPLILSAPAAPIHSIDWWKIRDAWDNLNPDQKSSVLVGTHSLPDALGAVDRTQQTHLLLDPPRDPDKVTLPGSDFPKLLPPPQPEPSRILDTAKRLPEIAAVKVFDLVSNPAAIILFFVTLWMVYKDRLLGLKRTKAAGVLTPHIEVGHTAPGPAAPPAEQASAAAEPQATKDQAARPEAAAAEAPNEQSPAAQPKDKPSGPVVTFAESPEVIDAKPPGEGAEAGAAAGETVKKRKGHRGRRGGVKHRKGNKEKRDPSQSPDDTPGPESVEEVVNKAKTLVREPKLEPDIITVPGDGDEVSGHILKMGSLEVNEAEQLGTGSNGTIVFAGKWDGRDVAVKRMLVQFNEIASQETRLLRESDDHPNGRLAPW